MLGTIKFGLAIKLWIRGWIPGMGVSRPGYRPRPSTLLLFFLLPFVLFWFNDIKDILKKNQKGNSLAFCRFFFAGLLLETSRAFKCTIGHLVSSSYY